MTRTEEVTRLIYKEESYAIIGACMAVYKDKGCGFLEPVYDDERLLPRKPEPVNFRL